MFAQGFQQRVRLWHLLNVQPLLLECIQGDFQARQAPPEKPEKLDWCIAETS